MKDTCQEKERYLLEHLGDLMHTGVYALAGEELTSYEESFYYNPLWASASLRERLCSRADMQSAPVILKDEFDVYFACIKKEKMYYLLGPLCITEMNRVRRHRFYHAYGVEEQWEKGLYYHTLMEILKGVAYVACLLTGEQYEDQSLVDANALSLVTKEEEKKKQILFSIHSDEEDIYRHTYQEERALLDMVREGNVPEAVRLSKELDVHIGRLGNDETTHWRNLLVVSVTLCARAAIEGGVMPHQAYRISGFYINKGSECRDITQILTYRNHAVEELASHVKELKEKKHVSGYIERCRDYVIKHYREKIYLEEIADTLGISAGYLSRLFKRETGVRLQDYVNDVRVEKAKNLLMFSEESLPAIAEYVNFPSQSYFGKIFKEKTGLTPREYREIYKPAEFYSG